MAYTFNGKANININNIGNSTFGNIKQANTTGDYITNKKAKLLFDMNSNKKRLGSLLNQTNLFLLKRAQLIKNIGIISLATLIILKKKFYLMTILKK